jgi:hypothetical protein
MAKVLDRVKIWTPFDDAKITLATFDERGKCKQKVESHNYATDLLMSQFKWWSRQYLTRRCGITSPTNDTANNGSYIEWMIPAGNNLPAYAAGASPTLDFYPYAGTTGPLAPPVGVVLTSATHAEDPTNDRYIRGGITAWSYVEGFTGTDTRRGGLNASECIVSPSKAVFVFDWATNSGNGTAQSVYWTYTQFSANAINMWYEMYMQNAGGTGYSTASTPTWQGSQSTGFTEYANARDQGLYLDPDGVSYWTIHPNSATADCYLVKRTLGTGALVSTARLNGSGVQVTGFTNDGSGSLGSWWTYDTTGNLRKWPTAGGTATSTTTYATLGIPQPFGGSFISCTMFFQGGYIWMQSTPSGGPFRMYQILASGPTLAASITIPVTGAGQSVGANGVFAGLYYPDATNGDELWLTVGNALVNRFDLSGNWRGAFTPAAVIGGPAGMALYPGGGVMYSYSVGSGPPPAQNNYIVNNCRQFHTRSLLPSPVTKSNTQTMKLTYEFDYT